VNEIQFLRVKPSELEPNPWNANEMSDDQYRKALASIDEFGFIDPITVRQHPDHPGYQIIDGEHRWRASLDRRLPEVPIILIVADDTDAEQISIVLNEVRGKMNPVKLEKIVRDLAQKRPMADLERILPFRRQQLAEMVSEKRDQIDWAELSQKAVPDPSDKRDRWVERIYRLPLDAAEVIDNAIASVKEQGVKDDWKALELICADYTAGSTE
jgi:hypothetical protein